MQSGEARRQQRRQSLRRISEVHGSGQLGGPDVSLQPSCAGCPDLHCAPQRSRGWESGWNPLCRPTRESVRFGRIRRPQAGTDITDGESHAPRCCRNVRNRRYCSFYAASVGIRPHRPCIRNMGSGSAMIVISANTQGAQHAAPTTCGVAQGEPVRHLRPVSSPVAVTIVVTAHNHRSNNGSPDH
jgi:hypothetical protein